MKKFITATFIGFCILFIADIFFNPVSTRQSGSPGNYSSSPADGNRTCAQACHGGTATTISNVITSNIPSDGYVAGQTYTITLTASQSGRTKYGFELSADNASNVAAGTFSNPTTETKLVATNNVTHTSSGMAAPSGTKVWNITWQAPANVGTGTVTFYVSINAANGDNGSGGDQIFRSSRSFQEKVVACSINELTVLAEQTELCEGASTNILVNASESDASYQLKNNATNANVGAAQNGNGAQLSFATGALSATTQYKVLVTKSNCNKELLTKPSISVKAKPIATITPDGPTVFCEGDSVVLTASMADSYLWNTGDMTQQIIVKGTGAFSVNLSANGCNSSSAIVQTQQNPRPNPPILSQRGMISICEGDSIVLSTGDYSNYSWSSGENTKSITIKKTGVYTVVVSNGGSCEASSADSLEVQLRPRPSAQISASKTQFCEGDSVVLIASNAANYLWSNGAVTQQIVSYAGGNFSVMLTDSFACTNNSDVLNIVFNNLPKPALSINNQDTLVSCETFELSTGIFSQYLWSTGSVMDRVLVNATAAYFVSVTDSNGCQANSDTLHVRFKTKPEVEIVQRSATVLESNISEGNQWHYEDFVLAGETGQQLLAQANGSYYSVVTTLGLGCVDTSNTIVFNLNGIAQDNLLQVKVYPNPAHDFLMVEQATDSELQLKLSKITGEIVLSEMINARTQKIVLPYLSKSVYVLQLSDSNKTITKRLTIE